MTLSTWLAVAGVCVLGAMSPGPSLAVVLRHTLAGSRRHGVAAALAHALGVGLYALLTALGLAVFLTRLPSLYLVVAAAGALYLAWLGIKALRAGGGNGLPVGRQGGDWPPLTAAGRDGFMMALLNPKIAVFFLALFSQFVTPEMGRWEHFVLAATAAAIDGGWYAFVALAFSHPALWHRFRRHAVWVERVSGVGLLGLAAATLLRLAT